MSDTHTDSLIIRQSAAERDELFRYADSDHPLIAALYDLALMPENGTKED